MLYTRLYTILYTILYIILLLLAPCFCLTGLLTRVRCFRGDLGRSAAGFAAPHGQQQGLGKALRSEEPPHMYQQPWAIVEYSII